MTYIIYTWYIWSIYDLPVHDLGPVGRYGMMSESIASYVCAIKPHDTTSLCNRLLTLLFVAIDVLVHVDILVLIMIVLPIHCRRYLCSVFQLPSYSMNSNWSNRRFGSWSSRVFCLLSCCIIVHVSVIDYLCWCCLCTGRRLHHPRQPARERQNLNNQHLRAQQRPRKKNDIRNGLWRPYASQGGEGHALLRHIIPCAVCLLVHASNFSMRMIGSMLIGHFCCFQERERYKEARFELLVLVRASSSSVRHVVFAGCASRASHLGATVLQYCSMLKQ